MKRKRQITIKDIAKELNVSFSTVSKALRNTHDISDTTRNKVMDKVKELGYRININARGLKNQKTNTIGVIIPHINTYYFSTVITGIQNKANESNFNVILFVTDDSAEREYTIINSLSLSLLDGLLICITDESICGHLQQVMDSGVPIVFFDSNASLANTSKVFQNDYAGAFMATEHLIAQGYKKIAHITGQHKYFLTKERLRGYADALRKNNMPVNPDWIVHSGFSLQDGYEDITQLWQLQEKPEAVFAVNDRKAIGAISRFKELNIQVGKEIGVMGFTNDPISSIITPSLSTIEEPAFEIGRRSCEILLRQILKKKTQQEEVMLPCKLIVRESTSK